GAKVDENQGEAPVEDAPRAVRPRLDIVPHSVAPEHVCDDGNREEEDDLQEQGERDQRPLEIQDKDDRRDRDDDDEPADGPVQITPPASHGLSVGSLRWSKRASRHPTSSSRATPASL